MSEVIDVSSYQVVDIRRSLPKHPTRKWKKRPTPTRIVVHTTASENQDPNKTAQYHIHVGKTNHISKKGCLPAGHRVRTTEGYKNIEDILIGEEVISPISYTAQKVIQTYKFPVQENLYQLHYKLANTIITATKEHPFLVWQPPTCDAPQHCMFCQGSFCKTKDYHEKRLTKRPVCIGANLTEEDMLPKWIRADQLKQGDFAALYLGEETEQSPFEEDLLYLAGWFLAEGWPSAHGAIQLALNATTERCVLEELQGIANHYGFPTHYRVREHLNVIELSIGGQIYHKVIKKLISGNRAWNKSLTKEFMEYSSSDQSILFEAYLKGDGSDPKRQDRDMRKVTTTSEVLWHQLFILGARLNWHPVKTLGRPPRTAIIQGRIVSCKQEYCLGFGQNLRHTTGFRAGKFFYIPIDKVEKVLFDGNVYNLTVEKEESYFVDIIPTHNCPGLVYHDFITRAGIIYHCNNYEDWTWHAGLYNKSSVGVVMAFAGQTNGVVYSPEQFEALMKHLVILCLYMKILPKNVIGHREVPGMFTILGKGSVIYKKSCLLPDSRILLSGKYIPISEAKVGDMVIGPKSHQLQRVSDVIITPYEGEILTITSKFDRFWPLGVTPDHQILAWKGISCNSYSRNRTYCNPLNCGASKYHRKDFSCQGQGYTLSDIAAEVDWVKAQDLQQGSYLALDLGKYDQEVLYTNEIAWLAGLYCAEGFKYQNDSVVLSFNKKTELYLARRAMSVAEQAGFPCLLKDARTALILIINNRFHNIVQWFVKGNKATNKHLTQEFLNTSTDYQSHFLAGYLKGDGSEDNKRIRFATSSEVLAHQMFVLLARLGFNPSKILGRPARECIIEGRTVCAQQEYSIEAVKNGDSWLTIRAGNYFLFPIEKIESSFYRGNVYDITVENDACFFANSLTVHNCPGYSVDLVKMRAELTLRLQRRLAAQGLYTGKIDGIFGKMSQDALSRFLPLEKSIDCLIQKAET